jgi:hypothetical protein
MRRISEPRHPITTGMDSLRAAITAPQASGYAQYESMTSGRRSGEFRRKIRTLAGNYQVLKYLPQLLGPGNRMWLHFVSYKMGRLLLPYALVAMAVSSLFLDGPIGRVVGGAQVAFYLIAALDTWLPPSPVKKISSPACTFAVMMIAAICALLVFFVPAQSLWTQSTIKPVKRPRAETPVEV